MCRDFRAAPEPRQSSSLCYSCGSSSKSRCRGAEANLDTIFFHVISSDFILQQEGIPRRPSLCYKTFLQSAIFLMHMGLVPQVDGGAVKLPVVFGAVLHHCTQPGEFLCSEPGALPMQHVLQEWLSPPAFTLWVRKGDQQCRIHLQHLLNCTATHSTE